MLWCGEKTKETKKEKEITNTYGNLTQWKKAKKARRLLVARPSVVILEIANTQRILIDLAELS